MPRQRPEDELHRAVVDHLRIRAHRGVIWFHAPNGGARNRVTGAMLKAFGTRAGVPDLLFVLPPNGRLAGLELKAPRGKVTAQQREFGRDLLEAGGLWSWANNIDDVLATLDRWGVIDAAVKRRAS